jgi:hypothetical protein
MSSDWKIYGVFEKKTNECIYVGRTSMSLENRWFYHTWKSNKSQGPLWKYMQEMAVNNFYIEVLLLCKDRKEWCEWETHIILELSPKFNRKLPGVYT